MKARTLLIAVGVGTAVALMVSSPAMAQSTDGSSLQRIEPVKADSKGSPDFAKARADAEAKARQNTDVTNKQKQTAVGVGIGGGASVDVKNKISNTNTNTLTTGDITNFNKNSNKQIQSFGVPILTPVR